MTGGRGEGGPVVAAGCVTTLGSYDAPNVVSAAVARGLTTLGTSRDPPAPDRALPRCGS